MTRNCRATSAGSMNHTGSSGGTMKNKKPRSQMGGTGGGSGISTLKGGGGISGLRGGFHCAYV
jgi:hypothetical protein